MRLAALFNRNRQLLEPFDPKSNMFRASQKLRELESFVNIFEDGKHHYKRCRGTITNWN